MSDHRVDSQNVDSQRGRGKVEESEGGRGCGVATTLLCSLLSLSLCLLPTPERNRTYRCSTHAHRTRRSCETRYESCRRKTRASISRFLIFLRFSSPSPLSPILHTRNEDRRTAVCHCGRTLGARRAGRAGDGLPGHAARRSRQLRLLRPAGRLCLCTEDAALARTEQVLLDAVCARTQSAGRGRGRRREARRGRGQEKTKSFSSSFTPSLLYAL